MRLSRLLPLFFIFFCHSLFAQDPKMIDTLKSRVKRAVTVAEKSDALDLLSRVMMNVNPQEAEEYGKQIIQIAEESRDRELMVKAYASNGLRCSYFGGRGDYPERSLGYYNKALSIARENKLPDWVGGIQLRMAGIYLQRFDKDKALDLANEGAAIISTLDNDSLKVEATRVRGLVYLARNNKAVALRDFLHAQSQADDLGNAALQRDCYITTSGFYSNIGDYDRAIDYYMKAMEMLDHMHQGNEKYQKAIYCTAIGNLYAAAEKDDIAEKYYNRSIAIADSVQFPSLKVPAYLGILNKYLQRDDAQKALTFFNSADGMKLKQYLTSLGFNGVIDQAYAVIYSGTGKLDSAAACFKRAEPFFLKSANNGSKISFIAQRAQYYELAGQRDSAISGYLQVKALSESNGLLEQIVLATKHLDSLYAKKGDYQSAYTYNSIYYKYKDSLDKLNKEKELAQVEAADEQQRIAKLEKQKEEDEIRRHNIQYMAITIGIAFFFVLLVVMGIFKVSESTIKVLGFFAFIMFFEFIILILDTRIHHLTHGEPWKVLGIKIVLIALLLPFHHWLEKKTITYLTSHNRLTRAGQQIRKVFMRKNTAGD